jgi:ribosome-associated translation inhibitor RaiA
MVGRMKTAAGIVAAGDISVRAREYVTDKLADLARFAPLPVLSAHARVTRVAHRDAAKRVIVEVHLDVNGRPVRVQVAAASSYEATDVARYRLRRKLSQLGWHPARTNGRPRPHRPGYTQRAAGQREGVRHKTFGPAPATMEEALSDLELMDYDFVLFTDAGSGMEELVCRGGAGGYQISVLAEAPRLTPAAAVGVLDFTDAPFIFFANTSTGRGNVLYRRHDGHYGLIAPAA